MTDNEKNLKNQVIALAGVAQAAALVDKLARTGYDEAEPFYTLIHGLLETNPASTESVFIDRLHLQLGLETLCQILQQGKANESETQHFAYNYGEILRYTLSMIHLERKLSGRKDMLDSIGKRLEQVKRQSEHFGNTNKPALLHESVLSNIASIYSDTISTFQFRIQVNGNPRHLQQEQTVHKIRSLLLCGIRSAVLWKQMGGSRFKILLNRKKHSDMARELLRIS